MQLGSIPAAARKRGRVSPGPCAEAPALSVGRGGGVVRTYYKARALAA